MKGSNAMSKSPSYCVLPFIHFALKPNGNAKPCCRFATSVEGEDDRNWHKLNHNKIGTTEVMNSAAFKQVRQAMLSGDVVPGCWKCVKEEKSAGYSMRTFYNQQYKDFVPNKTELRYLEVSFGNYCNLSCRTCNSGLSTTWYEDDVKLSKVYNNILAEEKIIEIPFNWKTDDFSTVNEIKFVGGEPMLNPNFNKFLETLLAAGRGDHTRLTIFSNSSWFPKQKTIDMLKKFKQVTIWLSIDAYGKKNDYIRNKSEWSVLSKCAEKWLDLEMQHKNLGVVLTPTLNFLNIQTAEQLVDWWIDNRISRNLGFFSRPEDATVYNSGDVVFSSVYDPEAYSLRHVPNKKELIKKYTEIVDTYSKETYTEPQHATITRTYLKISSMLNKDLDKEVDLSKFIEHTKDLDLLRNQNFKDTFPEVYEVVSKELARKNLTYDDFNGRL